MKPKRFGDESHAIMEELKKGRAVEEVRPELMSLFRPSVQPYMISWFKYDPAAEIANLEVPVLILQGTTDLQVPVEDAQLLAKAKPDAKLRDFRWYEPCSERGASRSSGKFCMPYSNPELPLAPGFLRRSVSFVGECCK